VWQEREVEGRRGEWEKSDESENRKGQLEFKLIAVDGGLGG